MLRGTGNVQALIRIGGAVPDSSDGGTKRDMALGGAEPRVPLRSRKAASIEPVVYAIGSCKVFHPARVKDRTGRVRGGRHVSRPCRSSMMTPAAVTGKS